MKKVVGILLVVFALVIFGACEEEPPPYEPPPPDTMTLTVTEIMRYEYEYDTTLMKNVIKSKSSLDGRKMSLYLCGSNGEAYGQKGTQTVSNGEAIFIVEINTAGYEYFTEGRALFMGLGIEDAIGSGRYEYIANVASISRPAMQYLVQSYSFYRVAVRNKQATIKLSDYATGDEYYYE